MRGGAREGAGRKPVAEAERRVSKTVRLPFGLIAEIQARADAEDVSFTTWLEDAAMEALRRKR